LRFHRVRRLLPHSRNDPTEGSNEMFHHGLRAFRNPAFTSRPSIAALIFVAAGVGLALVLASAPSANMDLHERAAAAQAAGCDSPNTPTGQANPSDEPEPMAAVWCFGLNPGPTTRVSGANDWIDTFQTNVQMQTLGAVNTVSGNNRQDESFGSDYQLFNNLTTGGSAGPLKSQGFINNNHWMFDLAGARIEGGTLLKPNRSFHWEGGTLVVESDVAAGLSEYGGADRFVEIDINTSPTITAGKTPGSLGINCGNNIERFGQNAGTCKSPDPLYGYGQFPGHWSLGCRLEAQGNVICSIYNPDGTPVNNNDHPTGTGRVWEVGPTEVGDDIVVIQQAPGILGNQQLWRRCQPNQMDMFCRDRFRLEVTKTTLALLVNGQMYFKFGVAPGHSISGIPQSGQLIPNQLADNPNFAYFTTWVSAFNTDQLVRFHWGRLAVNPHNPNGSPMAPSASPSYCPGRPQNTCDMNNMDPTPTPTSASPTPTPRSATATPTRTATPPPNATATRTPIPTGTPGVGGGQSVVTFDDQSNPGRPFSGQYPNGVIDWGNNAWYLAGPYGDFNGNSVSFNGAGPTSATLRFVATRTVTSVDVFNGGNDQSNVTIACPGQLSRQMTVDSGQKTTLVTNWTGNCSTVTVSSSNGWDTNFKNFAISAAAPPTATPTNTPTSTPTPTGQQGQTVTFDDQSNPNRPLNGQYPSGVIDWGNNAWYLSGPYGAFSGNSVSFNGAGPTSQKFTLVSPRKVVSVDIYNGGTQQSIVTLACQGQRSRQVTVAPKQKVTLATNWNNTCRWVTVSSSNGWDTNFKNIVLQ
jgi:hypothetical protein